VPAPHITPTPHASHAATEIFLLRYASAFFVRFFAFTLLPLSRRHFDAAARTAFFSHFQISSTCVI